IVPLDYSHPHGRKIQLAVSRVRHTVSASKYQGVMLVNPGGPGGSGLILSILGAFVPHNAGAAYDWIGFDPRGVGSSTPSLSCNRFFFHPDRPPYIPVTKSIMNRWVSRSKQYAADCAHAPNAALFRHVKTIDNVRDMESLRKALGKKQINYYGFSYGTYLGQVYATLHPNRVRRFVLDSNVDPRHVFYRSNQQQDIAFQKTFNIYFKWIAKYHSVYHLGATFRAVRHKYLATVDRLNRHAARGVLGGDEFTDVLTNAGYYVYNWEGIAKAWQNFANKHRPGQLINMYTSANPTTRGGDNGYAIYLGTQCTDAWWPHSQQRLNRDNWQLNRKYNYFSWANAWFNGPCAYWKFHHAHPVNVTGKNVHVPILLIDETFDPATPYEGSLYIRHVFPTSRLIEGKNGTTHAGSLSGVACTDDTIARYLKTGAVPRRKHHYGSDKVCPPVPKPNPLAGAATPSTAQSTAQPAVPATAYAAAWAKVRAAIDAGSPVTG
ncbi:MAG: alpha/beta fold hydrolase, partial [Mycobacterium sp.]|nr:alpha/beta fold hydrolase [Mycobacterium sp.]